MNTRGKRYHPVKPARSYKEQLARLTDIHGLTIEDEARARYILSTVNYYRLTTYGKHLRRADDPDLFLPGVSLETLYGLYRFDMNLRHLLLPVLEFFEVQLRAKIAYQLAITYGSLGYMDAETPTDFFGPATEHGVELFQRQVSFTEALGIKLDMDGWAGEQTLSILMSDSAPKYCVKEGMEGEDVSQMQKQLVDMGYMRKTTGYYGDETKAAMKDFQSRNGLSADGLAGEKTYDMLYSPKAKESPKKAAQKKTKANISKMIEVARSKLGCKYILGNTGPKALHRSI